MPSSRYDIIPTVLKKVVEIQPKTILDIGIGYGKWGVLFREYLDVWKVDKPFNERVVNIVGIEAFKGYKNPIWDAYDEVLIGDVKEIGLEKEFDLLFLGDVIEHFQREEAEKLLKRIKFKKAIIVTPLRVSYQQDVYGNNYERHLSSWSKEDFPQCEYYLINNQQVIIYDK